MPKQTNPIPSQVFLSTVFLSTTHSPRTVNKNASEFVIGTVKLSSDCPTSRKNQRLPERLMASGIK
jgi:hypothetical protein